MPRRVSLPGADELFRTTGGMALQSSSPAGTRGPHSNGDAPQPAPQPAPPRVPSQAREQRSGTATETDDADAGDEAHRASGAAEGDAASEPEHSGRGSRASSRTRERQPQQASSSQRRRSRGGRRPSGRERHDEKITVYVSAEELLDLEHARLVLRSEHGLAVDRGRIVREAVAVVLADLESRGDASILVRRLRGR